MTADLKNQIFRNTFTNYLVMGWSMFTSLFTTRILFLELGAEYYGFWALVWMVFGYSLLLDFGFGTSVQKYTSEVRVTKDFDKFNNLLSTVVVTYLAMSLIIILITVSLTPFLETIFKINSPENIVYFKKVFLFFGIGVALVFPFGVFNEVLKGLLRFDIANLISFVSTTFNLIGIILIFKSDFSLLTLTVFSLMLNLVTNLSIVFFVKKLMPEINISVKRFRMSYIREVVSFSLFAYLIMFANMIIFKTDQIILGIMLGISSVTVYHIGSRISLILNQVTTQFQANLAPVAASLYKAGEFDKLKWILLRSNRITSFITTGCFITLFFLREQILFVWLKVNDKLTFDVAKYMLISIFILIVFRSASSKFLLMTGHHKILSLVAISESIFNVLFSIIFIKMFGLIGVTYGTLLPNIIVSVFIVFPMACKFSNMSILLYFKMVYLPVVLISVPPVLFLYISSGLIPLTEWNAVCLLAAMSVSAVLYLIMGIIFYFKKEERDKFLSVLPFIKKNKGVN